jgi:serine protease Do
VSPLGAVRAADEPPSDDPALALALQIEEAFANAAERILPSVVSVSAFTRDAAWTPERLSERHGPAWVEARAEELLYPGFRRTGAGSGFVVAAEGFVLTCRDAVLDERGEVAELVDVEVAGDRHLVGQVVATEPTVDLAVVQVDLATADPRPELRAAPLGRSEGVRVGQWAIGVGDPAGAERTYAAGVVAARPERQCYQAERSRTLLQASVRVHPESYGGPLVDVRGAVIGMLVPRPGGGEGSPAGSEYALPIDLALTLYEALRASPTHRSPWLGVSVLDRDAAAKRMRETGRAVPLPDSAYYPGAGVFVDDVFDPSPASRAGFRAGDFIVKMNGKLVFSVADFQRALYLTGVGAALPLELFRDGESVAHTVTLESRPPVAATR